MLGQRSRPEFAAATDDGDPCSEAAAVYASAGLFPLSERLVFLKGADAADFLHTLSSNDIKSLAPGHGVESLFLTSKGKIQMPFTAWALSGGMAVRLDGTLLEPLADLIETSVVMEDVAIGEQPDALWMFHLAGPKHADVLNILRMRVPAPESSIEQEDLFTFSHDRTVERGVDIAVPESRLLEWQAAARSAVEKVGGRLGGTISEDILRIEAGHPKFGVDYTADHLPQEASREEVAVSFTKGCYTGQEVVARIKTYGGVNRRLVGLISDGPPACPGDRLFRDGQPAGTVTSAARSIKFSRAVALAMVSKGSFEPGTRLRVGSIEGPSAEVVDIARPGSLARAMASKLI